MLSLLLLSSLLHWGSPATDAPVDTIPLELQRLTLGLAVDYEAGAIRGTAALQLRNNSSRAVSTVPLLLNRLMTVGGVTDGAGRRLRFTQLVSLFQDDSARQVNVIRITPGRPLAPGDSLTITVRYGGILVGYTETGSLYIQDHVSRDFTILREDAYAFPVVGLPSWASNRTVSREPFAFDARITVPESLVVAAGGELTGRERRDSLITWTYRSTAPVPFLNVTIAPYGVLETPVAKIFYFPADSAGAETMQVAIGRALDRFGAWFGPLSGRPFLTVMEIPEGFGSQASLAAGIIQTADAFRARSELRQVYHELSHLWNVPDLDRPSPRWNEGLASFLQWRMAAELDGWNDWEARVNRVASSLVERCAAPARCSTVPMTGYGEAGETDRSYGVGMLLFYALYQVMGSERFDRAYRGFFQEHAVSGGGTDDLLAQFRREDPAVQPILEDWLTTTRWLARLQAGEKMEAIVEGYRAR